MKHLIYFYFFFVSTVFSQNAIETNLVKTTNLNVDSFISADNFGTIYFTKNQVFYKINNTNAISYNNLQLGNLFSVNTFNSLKINLFYKDFNTVVILDNRLAEIFKIDFNAFSPYKNVTHVSTGFDNTIWIFNQDFQKLELFDFKTRSTRAQTAPVNSKVLDLKSNYNYSWLLTEEYLYVYNYFGALVNKIENSGYTAIELNNENCMLKKANSLFYLKENTKTSQPIKIPDLLIKGFSVTNETLYIYDTETLHELQLKTN